MKQIFDKGLSFMESVKMWCNRYHTTERYGGSLSRLLMSQFLQISEETVETVRSVPKERGKQRIVEQIAHVPIPHLLEETVEV